MSKKIFEIIENIEVSQTIVEIQNTIEANNQKVGLHSWSENFLEKENAHLESLLGAIEKESDEYKKKEIIFFWYIITQGFTRWTLAREKQRIIDIIQIGTKNLS